MEEVKGGVRLGERRPIAPGDKVNPVSRGYPTWGPQTRCLHL